MSPETKVSIFLADDHEIVRRGVRDLLKTVPGWGVCGEASTGNETVSLVSQLNPDIVILDISMPPTDGLDIATQLRTAAPDSKVLVFTMHDSEEMIRSLLAVGVRGYVLKSDADKYLIAAIETVANGQNFFSSKVSDMILNAFVSPGSAESIRRSDCSPLSPREIEIAGCLAMGKSNKEIATALFISVKTVETHRRTIMQKLDISTIVELVHWAIRTKLIDSPI